MNLYTVPYYKNAPFLRLVIPFTCGILIQYYFSLPLIFLTGMVSAPVFIFLLHVVQPLSYQFTTRPLPGVCLNILLLASGCLSMYYSEDKNNPASILTQYKTGSTLVLTINEPLTEKPGSYKALGSVNWMVSDNTFYPTMGQVVLYFEKKPVHRKLKYGDIIIVAANLQPVSTTGNPAAFNYRKYCYFLGIHYQVFLTEKNYKTTGYRSINKFLVFIFQTRANVINVLQKYIPGSKESGLAQAILIGYKDNLDKELVQAYSNTGVVHVIAISGLHIGLIYGILLLLTSTLRNSSAGRIIQLAIVITCIWIFAIVAGASASVVRSAVMFTCIATGNVLARNLSVYNSLAASAFLLLAYNPFWIWDTGFQLSYAAVLSIVIYQKPVYHALTLDNKLLLMIWKTCAITLSAQILTTPVSLYYFHQFPNFFLITNFVAIPVSSLILIAEIILCCLSFCAPVAFFIGDGIHYLIAGMNWFVQLVDLIPFANWRYIQTDIFQQLLLYIVIAGISFFVFRKSVCGIYIAFSALALFLLLRSLSFYNAVNQQKLIVYNVSKLSAIELIRGRSALFIADDALVSNASAMRFNILPSRIVHRISNVYSPESGSRRSYLFAHRNKLFVLARTPLYCPVKADILIVSGNPRGRFVNFLRGKLPGKVVFDSSNSPAKIKSWSQECRRLGVPVVSVSEEGAFVMNLN
ncbi:ComEC/Rec2 family competence protein [Flavitalea antarctica]